MKCAIYTRVSTDKQDGKDFPLVKLKNIFYSKEQIQINLYYSEDFDVFKNSILPSEVGSDGDKKEKGTFVSFSENSQFVLLKMAPREGLEPPT